MTERTDGRGPRPGPAERVERLISEQLALMRKQLELMRAVQAAGRGTTLSSLPLPAPVEIEAIEDFGIAADPLILLDGASLEPAPRRAPLTDVQRDVWINCQLSPEGSAAYDLTTALRLSGELDVELLREALRRLVARHESLRTTFDADGDHQIVHPTAEVEMPVVDVSDRPEAERSERVAAFLDAELTTRYDLVDGPLFRATLIRTGEADHTLVLSGHHLVCDGTSLGVMQRDLSAIYSTLVRGGSLRLDEATQFSEYAAWRAEQSAASEPYWLSLYEAPPTPLDLPADKARPPSRSFVYGTGSALLGQDLLAALRDTAVKHGVTPFIVLLAAWEVLLHRLSGQSEFASGVYVAGQQSMGVRDLVGLCASLLPLRALVDPEERLSDHLRRLKRDTYAAFDAQHCGVGRLASALHLPRDASRPTLVSTVITLETPTRGIEFAGLDAVESGNGLRSYGAFDLEAYLTESTDDLTVELKYSTAIFDPQTIDRWLGYYIHLLRQMTADADPGIADLRLLDDVQRRAMLTRWNETEAPLPAGLPIEQFELQAARHPGRPAIRSSSGSLSYGELDARANRLARHLRELGVEADRLVGVHVDRTPDMVVALLAVHKAGGAFVPLDPLFPRERLAMIAAEAGLHALITRRDLAGDIPLAGAAIVLLDGDPDGLAHHDDSGLGVAPAPSDLAYVIFTSGSTGKPKGVEIEHRALANLLSSMGREPGLMAEDVLLAVTTISFDISILELFLPLTVGATVVLAHADEAVDAIWLRDRLAEDDITVMQATPATWQMLLDAGWPGTTGLKALCGGEALSRELAAALASRVGSLWNVYGPTETTIWSSASLVRSDGGPITIGWPIANTELHVLDPSLEPQPPGVIGGLFIGGMGLARGYRDQPELTAERFITHDFDGGPPRRLYRTGDLARRLADGRIEFLGRDDHQVKVRGFRIELGEIETVLSRHPGVQECAVVARTGPNGSKRLVAYVVPARDHQENVSGLRMHLRESLPEYMVPSAFVELEALPLTANRKVDRAKLPDPDHQRPDLVTALVAPRTGTEAVLARIWEDLLDLEQVGIEDNFFDLGGDSLLALRCIIQANRSGIGLAPNSIFRYQTIAELAFAAGEAAEVVLDEQGIVTGPVPLTPAQLRFLTERQTPEPHHWNVSSLIAAERLSPEALRTAVDALIRHHDALRLRLWQEDERWHQEIAAPGLEAPFQSHDLSALPARERSAAIERVCTELQGSFDLGEGLLLRVAHFVCGPDEPDRLFVTIHHFAVDGLTWGVVMMDLEEAYRQAEAGIGVSLPPKTTSFKAWATQLEGLAQTPRVVDTAGRWLSLPWDEVAPLPLDFGADRLANTNASAAQIAVELSPEETTRLLGSRRRPEHVILAALARCLSSWTASPSVLIDVLGHGRDAAFPGVDLSRTVGFTLSYNPLLLRHPDGEGTLGTLDAVTAQIQDAPEGFSFELLRFLSSDVGLRERLSALPRAELLFNYAGAQDGHAKDALWKPAPEPTGPEEGPGGLRQHPVAVRAALTPNLRLTFVYSRELHEKSTIEAKASEVSETIRRLVGEAWAAS
jgi:amino acid adenylation domain-containing protein/non-ribosomal peptide synthase protein (TIGR01720 family)